MEGQPIRLLVIEDNLELCDILESFFEITPEVECCGAVHNGEDALRSIALLHPDIILLDIIMPKVDGLAVLSRLRESPLERKPGVIVTSAIGQEGITKQALSLGAHYYMIKPYLLPDLLSRICMVAALGRADAPPSAGAQLRAEIARYVLDLGVSPRTAGYHYCIEAVAILLRENRPCAIVKEIYREVAGCYHTTPEGVESALRKGIGRAFSLGGSAFRTLVGSGSEESKPPSNGRFLTLLAERIRLERTQEVVYETV